MGENIIIAGVTFNDVPSIEVPKANGGIATYTLGSGVTVEPLSVTENGTYTAPTGKAYSPVSVSVSGGGTDELALLEENQLTSRTSTATKIKEYTYYGATSLQTMNMPYATEIGTHAFDDCTNLTSVDLPAALILRSYAFFGCTNLVSVSINPEYNGGGIAPSNCFRNCSSLELIDLKKLNSLASYMFGGCSKLSVFILRKDSVCALTSTALTGTPFASDGTGGTLYVPQDLIASYQSASNWSTILGYPNNQIKKIEGSIYE